VYFRDFECLDHAYRDKKVVSVFVRFSYFNSIVVSVELSDFEIEFGAMIVKISCDF
jgi:hypothetical protein